MNDKIKDLLSSKVTVRMAMELAKQDGIVAFHGTLFTRHVTRNGVISFLDGYVSVFCTGGAFSSSYGFTYDEITGIQYEWGL